MKSWTAGQILGVVGLILFIVGIAVKAESAADWAIGLGFLAAALAAAWGLSRFDRQAPGNAQSKMAVSSPPTASVNVVTSAVAPVKSAALVCSAYGARSTGTEFCPECGKPFQQKIACSQCGAQFQSGPKFCPECGTKT